MIELSIIYCTARAETNEARVLKLMPSWCELVKIENKGEKPLGFYRNLAVKKAIGKYVVVVDDDDHLHDNYFDEIKKGIDKNVDLISVYENQYQDNKLIGFAVSGVNNPYSKGAIQMRGVGHRDAILRSKVIECGNYNINVSSCEDAEIAMRLYNLLDTVHYIDKPIYDYYRSSKKKLYDKHPKADIISTLIRDDGV